MAGFHGGSDEFLNVPVPRERSIGWGKIAVTNVLFSICLPTLITGLDLAVATPQSHFFSGVVAGSLILTLIGILTSVLGSRTRLSSYMLARIAFGIYGSTLLIVILDIDTGHAITTEVLRYGQRVAVLALPCHPLLRTPKALAVVGPQAFGLEGVVFQPLPRH
jgi:hypothetical protein